MSKRLGTVGVAAALTAACAIPPAGPSPVAAAEVASTTAAAGAGRPRLASCTPQSLACFDATMTVTTPRGTVYGVMGRSEDLPTPGFENRWHYLLDASAVPYFGKLVGARRSANVCIGTAIWPDGGGGQWGSGGDYWRLEMRPTDVGIAQTLAGMAGLSECRPQWFEVFITNAGVEILIDEPRS